MLTSIAVAIAISHQDIKDVRGAYFPQLFSNPTGKNAYEDFVKAVDLLPVGYSAYLQREKAMSPAELQGARAARVSKNRQAIELVLQATNKPSTDPRHFRGIATLYPELSGFKLLGRLIADDAEVEFEAGHPAKASEILREDLRFGRQVSSGTSLISDLVGISIQGYAFDCFAKHVNELPASEWAAIDQEVPRVIPSIGQAAVRAIVLDRKAGDSLVRSIILNVVPSELKATGEATTVLEAIQVAENISMSDDKPDNAAKVYRSIRNLNADQQSALLSRLSAYRREEDKWLKRAIAGPEKGWTVRYPRPASQQLALVLSVNPSDSTETLKLAAMTTTRYRLLRLTGAIDAYRQAHQALPAALADLHLSEETVDPLSGKSFAYSSTKSSFDVSSLGNAQVPPVRLAKTPEK